MIIDDIKIYEIDNGEYIVEYVNENDEKITNQFENVLLATQFYNTLIINPNL